VESEIVSLCCIELHLHDAGYKAHYLPEAGSATAHTTYIVMYLVNSIVGNINLGDQVLRLPGKAESFMADPV
jgi:hypothetical protein